MGKYIAEQTIKEMIANNLPVKGADIIVLGLTFKENCPDLRNSKVIDVIRELQSYGATVHVHDPLAASAEAEHEYGVTLKKLQDMPKAQAIVAAVAHREYKELPMATVAAMGVPGAVFVDVKASFDASAVSAAGLRLWRL